MSLKNPNDIIGYRSLSSALTTTPPRAGKSGLDKICVLYQRHDHLKSRITEKECVYCEVQPESFNAN
jgi:hypothetical protein